MTGLDPLALVAEAARAPSAHNTQPARWRVDGTRVELHADPARVLPVADPRGHDLSISLGAAWEGMALALGRRGLRLALESRGHGSIATGRVESGGAADPLAAAVPRRSTWRGRFEPATAADAARLTAALDGVETSGGHALTRDAGAIDWLAGRADRASVAFLTNPAYFRELLRWVRLSPADPRWHRDGLNAEAMQLSGIDRAFSRLVARPAAHGVLRATGLLSVFAAEAPRTRSASAMLLLLAPHDEEPFDTGRRMYRLWLAATAAGWAGCPMSSLADDPEANREVRERLRLPGSRRLVNVIRLGIPPERAYGRLTPRLPERELLITSPRDVA